MKRNTAWSRLVSAARSAPTNTEVGAPFGFSSRLASLALSARPDDTTALFARFAWPALGVAALISALAVATNLKPVLERTDDDVAALSEPVVVDSGDHSA